MQNAVNLHRAGRLGEAEAIYRQVLEADRKNVNALYLLGLMTQATRRFEESAELFRRATKINPTSAKYWINLGLSAGGMGLGRTDEALVAFRKAVALDPNISAAWNNLGNELRNDGKPAEALDCYRKAMALEPNFVDAQSNIGASLQDLGDLPGAIEAFAKSVAIQPDYATGHWNLGFTQLLNGQFERGWMEYEWRFKAESVSPPRNFAQHLWDGGPIAGRTLLIHAEQGFGDTIHMVRYIPLIAERMKREGGCRIILECPAPLARLMQRLPGGAEIIPSGHPLPTFDVHLPTLSLPLVFRTDLNSIPADIPYLSADPIATDLWATKLPPSGGRKRIGLVWAGRPENKNDRNRSITLQQLAPLANAPVQFISLQKGSAAEQLRNPPAGMEIFDASDEIYDFADTAALIAHLDLVIAVDTAVAHLAGAMGKPVWVLTPFSPDWRWLMNRDDSPWYPTLRLFRQKVLRQWPDVIEQVAAALSQGPL
jgi:Flp pilus assembly protein TadD